MVNSQHISLDIIDLKGWKMSQFMLTRTKISMSVRGENMNLVNTQPRVNYFSEFLSDESQTNDNKNDVLLSTVITQQVYTLSGCLETGETAPTSV